MTLTATAFRSPASGLASRLTGIFLGLLLFAAVFMKWLDPGYGATLYGTLVKGMPIISWAILTTEALLGLWLLSGFRLPAVGTATVFLLALFTGAIVFDMFLPHPKPCGCFGAAWAAAHNPKMIERGLAFGVIRNAALMGLAAFLSLFPREKVAGTAVAVDGGAASSIV